MELNVFESEKLGTKVVSARNLHECLGMNPRHYSRDVKKWRNDVYGFTDGIRTPQEGKDFSPSVAKSNGGRPTVDFELSIGYAKLITLSSSSKAKQKYAQWLLSLERKVENLELLTIKQYVFIYKLVQRFSFTDSQLEMQKVHMQFFVSKNEQKKKSSYIKFHQWRNKELDIPKKEVDDLFNEFCMDNGFRFKKSLSKHSKMHIMDKYQTIRHAVWDYMKCGLKPEKADLVSTLATDLAKELNVDVWATNENALFHHKIDNIIDMPKFLEGGSGL